MNTTAQSPNLFDPLAIGELRLPNRVVMAPLTRLRAPGGVPNAMMAQYYAQRASAGLIISEGVPVSQEALGYPHVPGIWTREQVDGWRLVTDAVHRAGGRIFTQLWHVGRVSDPGYLQGRLPVAPSPIAPSGTVSFTRPKRPFVVPRQLVREELAGIAESFARAARHARDAGFDGVTIHGANGYLLDQFLQDGSNRRTDAYGGPVENRARLMLEVTDAVADVWGPQRVGMHLAPRSPSHSVSDNNPGRTFGYVARELGRRNLGFLFVRETSGHGALLGQLKHEFGGVTIANDGLDAQSAQAALTNGEADAVAFGRAYIANPDLVARLRQGAEWNKVDADTIYGPMEPGPRGYLDYPTLAQGTASA
jgi:2,4-dienoyl-CoA reductase-like NADH-dependent reductase (Old Yellow Enzyme family)